MPRAGIVRVVAALLSLGILGGCAREGSVSRGIAFTGVDVVDVDGDSVLPDQTVVVLGERITHVAPARALNLGPDVVRIDAGGGFLIPGLWDMHVHFQGNAVDVRSVEFPVYLAHGVTGIRVMAGCDSAYVALSDASPCMTETGPGFPTPRLVNEWRKEISSGAIAGPRIVAPSMMFDGTTSCYPAYALGTAEEARARVRAARATGADFIKIFNCSLSPELYRVILEEAAEVGIPVAGHVPRGVSLTEAARAGQRGLEHAAPSLLEACATPQDVADARASIESGGVSAYLVGLVDAFDPDACGPLVDAFRASGSWFSPTVLVNSNNVVNPNPRTVMEADERMRYLVPRTRRRWDAEADEQTLDAATWSRFADYFDALFRAVALLADRGVPLLAGSDAPNLLAYPGSGLHDELGLLVEAGLSPAKALAAATSEAARYLGREEELGRVAPGMLADLVLLDANPLTDVANTRRIRAVMSRGRLYDRARLDSLLDSAARAAEIDRDPF